MSTFTHEKLDLERAAILDACRILRLAQDDRIQKARALLDRVVAMLTALVRRWGADADARQLDQS